MAGKMQYSHKHVGYLISEKQLCEVEDKEHLVLASKRHQQIIIQLLTHCTIV